MLLIHHVSRFAVFCGQSRPSMVSERTVTVRLWKGLLVGMVAVGLAGCTSSASTSSSAGQSPTSSGQSPTAAGTVKPTAQPTPLPAGAKVSARTAAAQFDSAYFASRFADSWSLLAADARREVPKDIWVGVHDGCPAATSGVSRVIKSVTVFGSTAIVTETITLAQSRRHTVEYVFDYMDGHWGYSPVNPGIYHHGSISADVAAAKKAGLCTGWKTF